MKSNIPENQLAKWLSGEVKAEDVTTFESEADVQHLQQLVSVTDHLVPPATQSREDAWLKLQARIQQETAQPVVGSAQSEGKVIPFGKPIRWGTAIAAAIAVLVAVYFMLPQNQTFTTPVGGSPMAVNLPDGSPVLLNDESSLTFSERKWDRARNLELKGEAYFEVTKGDKFRVQTAFGDVQVLGTKFNVFARNGRLMVTCFEGKVQVLTSDETEEAILLPGSSVSIVDNDLEEVQTVGKEGPGWDEGKFTYQQVPMRVVLGELERQFDIRIQDQQLVENQIWSGVFFNNNLENALRMVGTPAKVDFVLVQEGQYRLNVQP
ncbi:MAG: FecR domain-containing protein [Bacteroidota bacterium]